VEVDVAGWVCWKVGRSSGAGLRAAVCADALAFEQARGGALGAGGGRVVFAGGGLF
jgi:hypothetical protein